MYDAPGGGIAMWRRIADELSAEIAGGTGGDRLPTEQTLAARYGVNRHTVRRAIAAMVEAGLVRVERGRGTFVQTGAIDYALGRRTRFSENLRRLSLRPSGDLIRNETLAAPAAVAKPLKIRPGTTVLLIETLGRGDDMPISIGSHYFPARRFPHLFEEWQARRSITAALAACGVADYTRLATRIYARPAEGDESRLLEQSPGRPVLVTESVNVDPDGRPVEFGVARFAADRVQFVVEL
ncbi:MAG: phosphonate metabolism transcriptional regulator PhnF [Alphaproteobacteria bacterium]